MLGKFRQILVCWKCYIAYVTCAIRICLIFPHSPLSAAHPRAYAYISGKSLAHVTYIYNMCPLGCGPLPMYVVPGLYIAGS